LGWEKRRDKETGGIYGSMEERLILVMHVACGEAYTLAGHKRDIVMIPFTGEATGSFFTGKTIGTGIDTQKISKDGTAFLSARYMLEGEDYAGNKCRVFVENQGDDDAGYKPLLVTDSPVLSAWEYAELKSVIEPADGGVTIKIYMLSQNG